jgi:hypothetical protein
VGGGQVPVTAQGATKVSDGQAAGAWRVRSRSPIAAAAVQLVSPALSIAACSPSVGELMQRCGAQSASCRDAGAAVAAPLGEPESVSWIASMDADRVAEGAPLPPRAMREPDPPPCTPSDLPTVQCTLDRAALEGPRVIELDRRARVEFTLDDVVHVHTPLVVDDRFVAAIPAAFREHPLSRIFWRAFATIDGHRAPQLDLRWRRLSEEREAVLRLLAPPASYVRVVAAESGVPLDALGERFEFERSTMLSDVDGYPTEPVSADPGPGWASTGGFTVHADVKEWWNGKMEFEVRAPGRVKRSIELDARGGGARELRLWPATELEIVATGEGPFEGETGAWLRSGSATYQWRSAIPDFVDGRAVVRDVPVGRVELVRDDLGSRSTPVVLATVQVGARSRGRLEVLQEVLATAQSITWIPRGLRQEFEADELTWVDLELHDGETRVPMPRVQEISRPKGDWFLPEPVLSACSISLPFRRAGEIQLELGPIDGFEPIPPLTLAFTAGERLKRVIPLTRERW